MHNVFHDFSFLFCFVVKYIGKIPMTLAFCFVLLLNT